MTRPAMTAWSFAPDDPGEIDLSFPLGQEVRVARSVAAAAVHAEGRYAVRFKVEESSRRGAYSMVSRMRTVAVVRPGWCKWIYRRFMTSQLRGFAYSVHSEVDPHGKEERRRAFDAPSFACNIDPRLVRSFGDLAERRDVGIHEAAPLRCDLCDSLSFVVSPIHRGPFEWDRVTVEGMALGALAVAFTMLPGVDCPKCFADGVNVLAFARAAWELRGGRGDLCSMVERLHDEEKTGLRAWVDFEFIDQIKRQNARREKDV